MKTANKILTKLSDSCVGADPRVCPIRLNCVCRANTGVCPYNNSVTHLVQRAIPNKINCKERRPAVLAPESTIREAPNYYVTDHFMYSDFICPCCDMLKIVPGYYRHVSLLERMRQELDFPIIVTSGYRCKSHNAMVGGSPRSWHLLFATDIKSEDDDQDKLEAMYEIAVTLGFGGIGRYETHLHLDLRPEEVRWRG